MDGAMRAGVALDEQPSDRSFAARIGDPRLRQLYDYWHQRRGARRCPARSDIDPVDIPALLPHLMLTEVIDGGARFRWRLIGTTVERYFGAAMTGRYIDDMLRDQYRDYIEGLYRSVVAGCTPVYSENGYNTSTAGFDACSEVLRTSRLLLPLGPDGETVTMVLVGQVFFANTAHSDQTVMITQDSFEAGL
jgi:hypothetical protein